MKADLNPMDLNALRIETPTMINDLPAGRLRLMQTAQGYVASIGSGEVRQENGKATGVRSGTVCPCAKRQIETFGTHLLPKYK